MASSPIRKVFEIDAGEQIGRAFTLLSRAEGFSGRAEGRMASRMRDAIRNALMAVIMESDWPTRTGRSQRIALGGVRAFGTRFTDLRGHILAPMHIQRLEEGGVIVPTRAGALAIPFGQALRPDGTAKLPGPRAWANIKKTFIYKSKRTGKGYIAYKEGKTLICLYVLVDMVEIDAQWFMRTEWQRVKQFLAARFGDIMLDEIAQIDLGKLARVTHKGGPK